MRQWPVSAPNIVHHIVPCKVCIFWCKFNLVSALKTSFSREKWMLRLVVENGILIFLHFSFETIQDIPSELALFLNYGYRHAVTMLSPISIQWCTNWIEKRCTLTKSSLCKVEKQNDTFFTFICIVDSLIDSNLPTKRFDLSGETFKGGLRHANHQL